MDYELELTSCEIMLPVVHWAGKEVERQKDSPIHVWCMLVGWKYAMKEKITRRNVGLDQLNTLAGMVKPTENLSGLRRTPVSFDNLLHLPPPAADVERLVCQLYMNGEHLEPAEWVYELLRIHPWADGNGRVACILFNAFSGTLHNPVPLPEFDWS